MSNKKQILGMFAALGANLIFGFGFLFAKTALGVAEPIIMITARFSVAFVIINLLLLTGKFKVNLKGKPKGKLILMAVMQPLLYFVFESLGLDRVSSALSGVIISLVPVAAMLFAVLFLKEKPTVLQVGCTFGLIVATGVISFISNDGSNNYVMGIIYLLLAVICAGLFNILSRSESKRYTAFERTYVMLLVGSVGYIILAFIVYGKSFIPTVSEAFCNIEFLIPMLYLGGLSSVGAFMLYNYSTTQITAVQSSSFSNIITVVTVVAGTVILKEEFSVLEYILSAIILLGVFLVNYKKETK